MSDMKKPEPSSTESRFGVDPTSNSNGATPGHGNRSHNDDGDTDNGVGGAWCPLSSAHSSQPIPVDETSATIVAEKGPVLLQTMASDASPRLAYGGGGIGGLPPRPAQVKSRQITAASGKISLQDLMEHSPLEAEADTYIQSTLDEVDPTRPGDLSVPQTTILGNVPPDAPKDAFQPATNQSSRQLLAAPPGSASALPLFKSKQTAAPISTAEDLWQLTLDMQQLERPHSLGSPSQQRFKSTGSRDRDGNNSRHSLVDNAVHIMKRHTASIQKQAEARQARHPDAPLRRDSQPAAVSAAERWKKLQQAVHASSGLQSKKSDDASLCDDAAGDRTVGGGLMGPSSDESHERNDDGTKQPPNSKRSSMLNSIHKKRGLVDYKDFEDWVRFKKVNALLHLKLCLSIMTLAAGIAAVLFYLAGNPPCSNSICQMTANTTSESLVYFSRASASWWLLFIGCRQAVTLTLARLTQAIVIDYFALRSKLCVRLLGPFVTLFIVQSRGWPFLLFSWGIYDFILLFGKTRFAEHWLFWQSLMGMFNEANPSGSVPSSSEYQGVLIVAVVVSFVVAVKRFWLGLVQGRRTYRRYGEDLAKVMKKALRVGQVGALARDIEESDLCMEEFSLLLGNEFQDAQTKGAKFENSRPPSADSVQEGPRKSLISGVEASSRKAILDELLGAWEEPESKRDRDDKASIASIIQFRQSLTYLNESFPFGVAFGPAATRQECVESAEAVYHRLMVCLPTKMYLTFDVLALLAVHDDGEIDEDKLKYLIALLRPDREGNLTLLDFAKSIDAVYKELRLLRASVANASRLDKAFESIFNIFFYFVLICIIVASIGLDPLVLFASISGFILGFAFMIGAACSKYFEGLLLIFVRRPYDIGDRIALSNPFSDTKSTGSQSWIVKDIDLYTTTVVLAATNEVSTISNGSLAGLRIINCARSPKANLNFLLKFPIHTSYAKLQIFKSALEKFVKARPREWARFSAFRATRVEADQGFVEYIVIGQHRESWQNLPALLESKAQVSSFALELSKKMDMRYVSPPMPIDLSVRSSTTTLDGPFQWNPPVEPESMERDRTTTEDFSRSMQMADSVAALFGTRLSPTKAD